MALSMELKMQQSVRLDPRAIATGLRTGMVEAVAYMETQVRKRTPQGVGGSGSGLRASIFGETRETPGIFRGVVGSNLAYAIVIEEGRRAGQRMPPPSALIPWVARTLTIEPGQTIEGVAFLVAKSIGAKGFKGKQMFEKGLAASRSPVQQIFERAGLIIEARVVKTKTGGILGDIYDAINGHSYRD